ncbi:MAG: hypothetical protein WD081_03570 [Gammaproteobacteria bacterium]
MRRLANLHGPFTKPYFVPDAETEEGLTILQSFLAFLLPWPSADGD